MSKEAVARRYARAVFEIGKEAGALADVTRQMGAMAETWRESAELREALDNPLIPVPGRDAILKEIGERLGFGDVARNTMRVLTKNRRLSILTDLHVELSRLADEDARVLRAAVTSASPLSESYLGRLKAELEKATGKKVAITNSVDPTLLAGVVTQIGDQVIDGSARARLASFRDVVLSGSTPTGA